MLLGMASGSAILPGLHRMLSAWCGGGGGGDADSTLRGVVAGAALGGAAALLYRTSSLEVHAPVIHTPTGELGELGDRQGCVARAFRAPPRRRPAAPPFLAALPTHPFFFSRCANTARVLWRLPVVGGWAARHSYGRGEGHHGATVVPRSMTQSPAVQESAESAVVKSTAEPVPASDHKWNKLNGASLHYEHLTEQCRHRATKNFKCCPETGVWIDDEFPPTMYSLCNGEVGFGEHPAWRKYVWRRASDVYGRCGRPLKMFNSVDPADNSIDPTDVMQGVLGDCYFLGAVACLAEESQRIRDIFITQEVNDKGRCVVFFVLCVRVRVPVYILYFLLALWLSGSFSSLALFLSVSVCLCVCVCFVCVSLYICVCARARVWLPPLQTSLPAPSPFGFSRARLRQCRRALFLSAGGVVRTVCAHAPALRAVQHRYVLQFYKTGQLRYVVVDDYIPCLSATGGPAFSRTDREWPELWVMLLEKAWAKVHGSYFNIEAGRAGNALEDLTGAPFRQEYWRDEHDAFGEGSLVQLDPFGSGEFVDESNKDQAWNQIKHACKKPLNFPMTASMPNFPGIDAVEKWGLQKEHSYSIIRAEEHDGHRLLYMRNPQGQSNGAWRGNWGEASPLWTPGLRKKLKQNADADGLFWMSFDDFCYYFYSYTILCLYPKWSRENTKVFKIDNGGSPGVASLQFEDKDKDGGVAVTQARAITITVHPQADGPAGVDRPARGCTECAGDEGDDAAMFVTLHQTDRRLLIKQCPKQNPKACNYVYAGVRFEIISERTRCVVACSASSVSRDTIVEIKKKDLPPGTYTMFIWASYNGRTTREFAVSTRSSLPVTLSNDAGALGLAAAEAMVSHAHLQLALEHGSFGPLRRKTPAGLAGDVVDKVYRHEGGYDLVYTNSTATSVYTIRHDFRLDNTMLAHPDGGVARKDITLLPGQTQLVRIHVAVVGQSFSYACELDFFKIKRTVEKVSPALDKLVRIIHTLRDTWVLVYENDEPGYDFSETIVLKNLDVAGQEGMRRVKVDVRSGASACFVIGTASWMCPNCGAEETNWTVENSVLVPARG